MFIKLVIVLAVIAQHAILDVGAFRNHATLRWEADFAEHAGMLVIFANDQAYLSILHCENGSGVTVAAFHKVDQAVGKARFYLSHIFAGRVAHEYRVPLNI